MQWGFYFDQTRCVNCKACVLACKSWNEDKRGDAEITPELTWLTTGKYAEPSEYDNLPGTTGAINYKEYSKYHMKENWRKVLSTEFGTAPPEVQILNFSVSCNHCENPACIKACPLARINKDEEFGIVKIDSTKTCIGCKKCQVACPWKSPQFYDENVQKYPSGNPDRPKMTKCDLCFDRIKIGLKPACVASCIMRALDAGPIAELKERYPNWTNVLNDISGALCVGDNSPTKPNIIYKEKKLIIGMCDKSYCKKRTV